MKTRLFSILLVCLLMFSCASQAPAKTEAHTQPKESAPVRPSEPAPVTEPAVTQPAVTEPAATQPEKFNPSSAGSPNPKVKMASPPPCCNGPYWHKIYRATSADGITWTKDDALIMDHASVPSAIKINGKVFLYYVNGEYDTFDCAFSDDGRTFTYGDCRIYGFKADKAWDPIVVQLDDGRYRLYFYAPRKEGTTVHTILSAVSEDGISWLQEEGARFEHDGIMDPDVIKYGGKWLMYTWYGDTPDKSKIIVAESDDGLSFTEMTEVSLGGGIPDAALNDGKLNLYFCGNGISLSTSEDGTTFSAAKTVLRPKQGEIACDPAPLQDGDSWIMYYKVQAMTLKK